MGFDINNPTETICRVINANVQNGIILRKHPDTPVDQNKLLECLEMNAEKVRKYVEK